MFICCSRSIEDNNADSPLSAATLEILDQIIFTPIMRIITQISKPCFQFRRELYLGTLPRSLVNSALSLIKACSRRMLRTIVKGDTLKLL